jgi:quercetin dioxygenase-like cupin family protein
MRKPYFFIAKLFVIVIFLLFICVSSASLEVYAQTSDNYTILNIKNEIGDGKDKEVIMLFEGERRKIAQLTLRNSMRLESHSVKEPFILQCIAGKGELIIGEGETAESIELLPGTHITVEANVLHDVVSQPAISILLIKLLKE